MKPGCADGEHREAAALRNLLGAFATVQNACKRIIRVLPVPGVDE